MVLITKFLDGSDGATTTFTSSRAERIRLNPSVFTFHYSKPILNENSCALEMSGGMGGGGGGGGGGGSVGLLEKILILTVGESVYYVIVKCP